MHTADVRLYGSTIARPGTFNGINVREDLLFTNHHGQENRSIKKFAEKALAKLQEPLSRLLAADEAIVYVARMQAPASGVEKYTLGWMIYRLTTVHAVFTDRRVLFFRVQPNGKWTRSTRVLEWPAVASASVRGWMNRVVEFTFRNGKKAKYWRLRGRDAKKLNQLLPQLMEPSRGSITAAEESHALCPECFAALSSGVYCCQQCGLVFKDESTMLKLALLIPGGGYFYTGNYGLALLDFIAEAYLLLLLLILVLAALGDPTAVEAGEAVDPEAMVLGAGFVLAVLVLEKLMTIHHCRRFVREYLPTKKKSLMAQTMSAAR